MLEFNLVLIIAGHKNSAGFLGSNERVRWMYHVPL